MQRVAALLQNYRRGIFLDPLRQRAQPSGIGFARASRRMDQAAFTIAVGCPNFFLKRKRSPTLPGEPLHDRIAHSLTLGWQQRPDRFQRIGFFNRLVGAPAQDARETDSDTRFVPRGALNALEREFKNKLWFDRAYRAKLLVGVLPDKAIYCAD